MSPYSMLLLTNQAMYTGQTEVLKPKVKTRSHVAASAPSFFSMGPEEEVFDIELDGFNNNSEYTTPTSSSYKSRGSRTPGGGNKNRRVNKTPGAPGGESKSCGRQFHTPKVP